MTNAVCKRCWKRNPTARILKADKLCRTTFLEDQAEGDWWLSNPRVGRLFVGRVRAGTNVRGAPF